jgi:hypothetical protein
MTATRFRPALLTLICLPALAMESQRPVSKGPSRPAPQASRSSVPSETTGMRCAHGTDHIAFRLEDTVLWLFEGGFLFQGKGFSIECQPHRGIFHFQGTDQARAQGLRMGRRFAQELLPASLRGFTQEDLDEAGDLFASTNPPYATELMLFLSPFLPRREATVTAESKDTCVSLGDIRGSSRIERKDPVRASSRQETRLTPARRFRQDSQEDKGSRAPKRRRMESSSSSSSTLPSLGLDPIDAFAIPDLDFEDLAGAAMLFRMATPTEEHEEAPEKKDAR